MIFEEGFFNAKLMWGRVNFNIAKEQQIKTISKADK